MSYPPRIDSRPPVLPELSFQAEHTAVAGATAVSSVNDPQVLQDLEHALSDIFAPHETSENKPALAALVKDRATQLQAMGQTAADVERLLDKATRMDRVTLPIQGAIGSTPFAVASVLLDRVPDITAKAAESAAYTGFVAGSMSGAVDAVASGVLARATHDTFWLKAPDEVLEPVMQEAKAARSNTTLGSRTLEAAVANQTFTLRNVVRGLVATTLTATKGPKAAAAADTALSSAGGMLAGAGSAVTQRAFDMSAHRAGPEYLFGRQDWKKQYETLRDCSPARDPLINGGKRLAKLPVDILTDTVKSFGKAISATSLATNALALGGGGAVQTFARSTVKHAAASAGLPPAAIAAADAAANVAMSAVSFGAYGAIGVLTDPASEAAAHALQHDLPPKAASMTATAGEALASGVKAAGGVLSGSLQGLSAMTGHLGLGTAAERGADSVAGLANQFRQRPARSNGPQGESDV